MPRDDGSAYRLLRVGEPHSCANCQKIVIKEKYMKRWDFMIRIPHTKAEARRAAAEGCPLFQLFVEAFVEGTTLPSLWRAVRALASPTEIKWAIPSPLCRYWYSDDRNRLRLFASRFAYILSHILLQRHLYLTFSGPSMSVYYLIWRDVSKAVTLTAYPGESRRLEYCVKLLNLSTRLQMTRQPNLHNGDPPILTFQPTEAST